jgi:azurin
MRQEKEPMKPWKPLKLNNHYLYYYYMTNYISNLWLLALLVFAVSCGSSGDNQSNNQNEATRPSAVVDHPTEFTIRALGNTMPEMAFDVRELRINAGKTITINLINEGENEAMIHNFVVVYAGYAEQVAGRGVSHKDNSYVEPGDQAVLAVSPLVQPLESAQFTFTIKEKGTYQFVCTYPGHYSRMMGNLIVE